jgi:hypothetical protein
MKKRNNEKKEEKIKENNCKCQKKMNLKKVFNGKNKGRYFYSCEDCKTFQWSKMNFVEAQNYIKKEEIKINIQIVDKNMYPLIKEREGIFILLDTKDYKDLIKEKLKNERIITDPNSTDIFFEIKYYKTIIEKLKTIDDFDLIPKFSLDGIKKQFVKETIKWSLIPQNLKKSLLSYQKECLQFAIDRSGKIIIGFLSF